ncbi:MAG: hypothetical protein Greene101447_163 [Parcubacteria group bacterium Greene1014_47]|nr:MAG: hypothetical protein Greene101447_163 [Parcubacteria group bacterium Greene1014_47]
MIKKMRAHSLSLLLAVILLFVAGGSVLSAPRTDIPAPSSPSPQNNGSATIPVTLQWSKVTFPFGLAGGYLLEVVGGGVNRSGVNSIWTSANSSVLPEQLVSLAGQTYQWRVRACLGAMLPTSGTEDSVCGNWGSGIAGFWTFTTALSKPILLLPKNNELAFLQPIAPSSTVDSVKLEWQKVPGFIDSYKIILSNSQFAQPFEFKTQRTASGTGSLEPATSFWIPKQLVFVHSEPYSWRVVPIQGVTTGPSSDTWKFMISLGEAEPVKPKPDTQAPYPLVLEWSKVSGASRYAFQVTDSKGETIPADTPQLSFPFPAGARNDFFRIGENYTWQVTACQTLSLCGVPGGPWRFTLGLASPTLENPKEGSTISSSSPTFKWSRPPAPPGDLRYSLEVEGPKTISVNKSSGTTPVTFNVSSLVPGSYIWRVRACKTDGSACSNWSADATFKVPTPVTEIAGPTTPTSGAPPTSQEPFSPLNAPSLISPANNANDATTALPLTLTWNTVDFEGLKGGYAVELLKAGDNKPLKSEWVKSDKHSLDNLSTPLLKIGTTYRWRVQACLGDSAPTIPLICSNWGSGSGFWDFTPTLVKPVLRFPADKSNTFLEKDSSGTKSVHLEWNVVAGAESYVVSLRNLSESNVKDFPAGTNDVWIKPELLTVNNQYTWKVKALSGTNKSPDSATRRFTVLNELPASEITAPTENQQITAPASFTFKWKRPSTLSNDPLKYKWAILEDSGSPSFSGEVPATASSTMELPNQQLTKLGQYTFYVQALGADGSGAGQLGKVTFSVVEPISGQLLIFDPEAVDYTVQGESHTFTLKALSKVEARAFPLRGNITTFIQGEFVPFPSNGKRTPEGFSCVSGCTYSFNRQDEQHSVVIDFILPGQTGDVLGFASTQHGGRVDLLGQGNILSASIKRLGASCDLTGKSDRCASGLECKAEGGGAAICKASATATAPTAPGVTAPSSTIFSVADKALNVAFTALLIAASLFVLLAAFQFVTGGDNPEMIAEARGKLAWAAVGIGVALVAKGAAKILQEILLPSEGGGAPKDLCPGITKSADAIQNPLKTLCFSGILDSILNVIFTLSLIVVPFVVIYAGFLYVTGGSNPAQITKARDTLIWTAIGFGVILIAKGLPFILKDILGI